MVNESMLAPNWQTDNILPRTITVVSRFKYATKEIKCRMSTKYLHISTHTLYVLATDVLLKQTNDFVLFCKRVRVTHDVGIVVMIWPHRISSLVFKNVICS